MDMIESTANFIENPKKMTCIFYEIYDYDKLIGNICIYSDFPFSVKIGLYVFKRYSGLGYGTESTKLLVEMIKKCLKMKLID